MFRLIICHSRAWISYDVRVLRTIVLGALSAGGLLPMPGRVKSKSRLRENQFSDVERYRMFLYLLCNE